MSIGFRIWHRPWARTTTRQPVGSLTRFETAVNPVGERDASTVLGTIPHRRRESSSHGTAAVSSIPDGAITWWDETISIEVESGTLEERGEGNDQLAWYRTPAIQWVTEISRAF
jgi:hypothetical protein